MIKPLGVSIILSINMENVDMDLLQGVTFLK